MPDRSKRRRIDIVRALRHASRRYALFLCVASISAGCAVLAPTPTPQPTRLEPAPGIQVEVAVDNRSGDSLAMTVSQGGQPGPYLMVGECEASNFIYPMDGPFTVGLGKAADFSDLPMPPLVESSRLELAGGEYRLLIRVGPTGDVTFGPLEGEAPIRGAGC